jgi:hypothetical protein
MNTRERPQIGAGGPLHPLRPITCLVYLTTQQRHLPVQPCSVLRPCSSWLGRKGSSPRRSFCYKGWRPVNVYFCAP